MDVSFSPANELFDGDEADLTFTDDVSSAFPVEGSGAASTCFMIDAL